MSHASATAILDSQPIRPRQWIIVALVLTTLIVDGLDFQLLSLVTPLILLEWAVGKAAFGSAMGAALIGMALGASIGGWLGDRFGRKTMLVGSALVFGLTTMATSLTHDVASLAMLRLVSGLGFGAATPNGIALASEWLPDRARAGVVSLCGVAPPFGGIVGSGVTLLLLPALGWRGCFVACGAATLILAVVMAGLLPESISYLLGRGRRDRAAASLRRVIGIAVDPAALEASAPADGRRTPAPPPGEAGDSIFAPRYRRFNAAIWVAFPGMNLIAYSIAAWTPVYLTMSGFTLGQAIQTISVHNIAAVSGALSAALFIGRFGSRRPLAAACALTFVSVLSLAAILAAANGAAPASTRLMVTVACASIGFFNGAAIAMVYALLSNAYSARFRASGVGFGIMMGRVGGIVATTAGGALLAIDGSNVLPFFGALGVCALLALAGAIICDRHLPPRAGRIATRDAPTGVS